jgi:hypothetical protein
MRNSLYFTFSKEGIVKVLSANETKRQKDILEKENWVHTNTVCPAKWIEEMANGQRNPSDMLDEIQFTK